MAILISGLEVTPAVTIPEWNPIGYGLSNLNLRTNVKTGVVSGFAVLTQVSEDAWQTTGEGNKSLTIEDLQSEIVALGSMELIGKLQSVTLGLLDLCEALAIAKGVIPAPEAP